MGQTEEMRTNVDIACLQIQADILGAAIRKLVGSIAKQSTQEVLQGIYLQVDSERLTLRAGNYHHYIETVILNEDAFHYTGPACGLVLPGRKLNDILTQASGATLHLQLGHDEITLMAHGAKMNLKGLPIEQFPAMPTVTPALTVTVSASDLVRTYRRTVFSVSKSESRPALTGVLHQFTGSSLRCVATDAHRLAQCACDVSGTRTLPNDCIVPAESIHEVVKHVPSVDVVTLQFDAAYAIYQIGFTTLYVRLLGGQYPDTASLVPSKFNTHATFDAHSLRDTLRRASLYTESGKTNGFIIIQPELKQVRVLSDETAFGTFQEDLIPAASSGRDVAVYTNLRYILDALGSFSDEEAITFDIVDSRSPIVLRSDKEGSADLNLITQILTGQMPAAEISDFRP